MIAVLLMIANGLRVPLPYLMADRMTPTWDELREVAMGATP
jgi:hypothetical protein